MSQGRALIPLSQPYLHGKEWRYVKECLDTGWVSSVGSFVDRFEQTVSSYIGASHGVACASGTAALHTALLVLGLKADEEVIMPDLTFAAPAFAVKYMNAYPAFIDMDRSYCQMDPDQLKDFLESACIRRGKELVNRHTKRVVKGIIPVHLLGHPSDMDAIGALARKYRLWIVEDAAEGIGAEYKSKKVGSYSDMACFSFNGNKVVTCGGGGMIVTSNKRLADKSRYLTTQAKDDPLEYIHRNVGYNYRLTNVAAAIGVAQMEQLDGFIRRKKDISRRYQHGLRDVPGIGMFGQAPWASSIFWLNTLLVDHKKYGMTARALLARLSKDNVQARPLWHPLSGLPIFKDCYAHNIHVSKDLYRQALSIPSSPQLSVKDQDFVIQLIKEGKS